MIGTGSAILIVGVLALFAIMPRQMLVITGVIIALSVGCLMLMKYENDQQMAAWQAKQAETRR